MARRLGRYGGPMRCDDLPPRSSGAWPPPSEFRLWAAQKDRLKPEVRQCLAGGRRPAPNKN